MRQIFQLLSIAMFTVSCTDKPEKIQPVIEKISESVYASGIIKSKNQYRVFSTVGGLVQKILVREGDIVKKGEALFVIQNETSKLNAENAQLAADFAEFNIKGGRLNELKAAIETAKSKLMNDSILLVRQRALWEQNIGSKVELEQRELAYSGARSNYYASVFRFEDLQKQLQLAAGQSRKQLSISKNMVQDYIIRSQTAGRVYSITITEGEIVNNQTPVAVIGNAEEFVVELQIDENDIVRVKKGQRVLLTLDSYKGQVFEAEVLKIDPIMNDRSRTFSIEAVFIKQPPVLYPNLTTEANIIIQVKEKAMTIPRSYLLNDTLVILENNEKQKVATGLKDYLKVEILSGLEANQIILKPVK